jgi:hypothetical protein
METRKKAPGIKRVLENGDSPVNTKVLKQT